MARRRRKLYIVYDGRACGDQGTDDAMVMVSCDSLEEARSYNGDYGQVAIYSYDIYARNQLKNERWVEDYIPED